MYFSYLLFRQPLDKDKFVIRKSRYDCIDMYLSPAGAVYNDIPILYEKEHLDLMLEAGKEPSLWIARNCLLAYWFIVLLVVVK